MGLYRIVLSLLAPGFVALLLWRRLRGRESARSFRERFGRGTGPAPAQEGTRLWLHGASNGEIASARWLIEAALHRAPDLSLIVTCDTETARDMVEAWAQPRIRAALAPIDTRAALGRFLDLWRPSALLLLENEIWPNRLAEPARRGIAVMVFGARMSRASARVWARFPGLAAEIMGKIGFLSAQDPESEARFRALGCDPGRIGPMVNLKARLAASAAPHRLPPVPDLLRHAFSPATTLLAASTHPGEEAVILDGFAQARAAGHARRLILAPRHPRRRAEIEALIREAGLAFVTRSTGAGPGDAPVYLADTMGEMELWYRLAGLTFVGGSLAEVGGHTPFEPARFGSVILHGPNVANFAQAYRTLDLAGAARRVGDAEGLAAALAELDDAGLRARIATRAHEALAGADTGAEGALFAALAAALDLPELRG